MSASTTTSVRTRFEGTRSGAQPLRLVRRLPRESGRLPFALLIIFLVAAGLVGLLIVNTSLQSGAFEAGRLQQDNQLLAERQGDLQRQVQELSSPGEVTRRAGALGMVPDPDPGFLRLSDGKVLGDPQPATKPRPSEEPASATKPDSAKKPTAAKKPRTTKPATAKPATTKPATTKKPAATTTQGTSGGNR